MTKLARLFIAVVVCPTMGGIVGEAVGRALAAAGKAEAGVLARWEVVGLLVGGLVGLVYAVLLTHCIVGFQGRLRKSIADPVVIALGMVGVIGLLMRRATLPAGVAELETAIMVAVWVLGLVFVIFAARIRPAPAPVAVEPPPGGDDTRRLDGGNHV